MPRTKQAGRRQLASEDRHGEPKKRKKDQHDQMVKKVDASTQTSIEDILVDVADDAKRLKHRLVQDIAPWVPFSAVDACSFRMASWIPSSNNKQSTDMQ